MKIIHLSDTHLGYSNFDKVNEFGVNIREQDFYDAFEKVVSQILEIKPNIVIHSGDFFHRPSPSNRAMTFALEQLKKISNNNIPFVVIAGNHSTPKTIYTSPILKAFKTIENVYPIFNQQYEWIDFGDVVIHGLPHINDLSVQQQEIEKIKITPEKRNILMLHTSLGKSFLMEEYGEQLFPSNNINLLEQFDYVALGHWHNFQKVSTVDNAWYSGSTERMSDSEINCEKGLCVLNIRKNEKIIPEFINIKTRNWYRLEIRDCYNKSAENILDEINDFIVNNEMKDCIVNIIFQDIKTEQTFELSNVMLKELLKGVFNLSIKRKAYQEKDFFAQIETEAFDRLNDILASFIRTKFLNKQEADALIDKANYYFHQLD